MGDFPTAIRVVLGQEGWGEYTDRHNDLGGPTKYGITQRTLSIWRNYPVVDGVQTFCPHVEVMNLTEKEALDIYETWYWFAIHGNGINDQTVATKLLSLDVNTGPHETVLLLQRCLNAMWPVGPTLAIDGVMGPLTLNQVNASNPQTLLVALIRAQAAFYTTFGQTHPEQADEVPGLLVRAAWPYANMAQVPA